MATPIGEVFIAISPETAGFMTKLQSQVKAMNFASGLGIEKMLGGAAIAGAVAGLFKIGSEFRKQRRIIQQETGAMGADLDALANTVYSVFKRTPFALGTVTTAVDMLYRRGVPLGHMMEELAIQEAYLAKITGTDLAGNVETVTALFNKWQVSLRDQPAALDAIYKASQQSGLSISQIMTPLKANQAALKEFGFSLVQSTALIANLGKAGFNVQQGLGALRMAFARIAREGGDPQAVLKRLFEEFKGGTSKTLASADAMRIFGARGGVELVAAIKSGKFNVKEMLDIISNGKGGITETGERLKTLGDRFKQMGNAAQAAVAPIGMALVKGFSLAVTEIEPSIQKLAEAFGGIAVALAPVVAALGGALLLALKGITPVIDSFAAGLQIIAEVLNLIPAPGRAAIGVLALLGFGLKALQANFLATAFAVRGFFAAIGPVGWAIIGITAAVALFGAEMNHFKDTTISTQKITDQFKDSFLDFKSKTSIFQEGIGKASDAIALLVKDLTVAGKLPGIDKLFEKTGSSLADLSGALGSTAAGWSQYLQAQLDAQRADGKWELTSGIKEMVRQRSAIENNVKAMVDFRLSTKEISAAEKDMILAIASGIGPTDGAAFAMDRLNQVVAENTIRTEKNAMEQLKLYDDIGTLKSGIIAGSISMSNAAATSSQFNLSIEQTKTIIKETTAALKQFVAQAVSGLPQATKTVEDWYSATSSAFTKLADDAKAGTGSVVDNVKAMQGAMDPQKVIDQINAQSRMVAAYADNLITLVARFPFAVNELLKMDTTAAASFAATLVRDDLVAAGFDRSIAVLSNKTGEVEAAAKGPLAQRLLAAGIDLGKVLPGAASRAIQADDRLAGATRNKVAATGDAARQGALQASPQWQSAMAFLAAVGAGKFKPDLKTPAGRAVADAAAEVRKQQNFQAAMSWLAKRTEEGFVPNWRAKVKIALGQAADETKPDSPSVGNWHTQLRNLVKRGSDEYKKELTLKEKTRAALREAGSAIAKDTGLQEALKTSGLSAGGDFGQGLADGIETKRGTVYIAGQAAGTAAMEGVRSKIKNKSPSRVAFQYGQDFTTGLALGVVSLTPLVRTAGEQAAAVLVAPSQAAIITGVKDSASLAAMIRTLQKQLDQLQTSSVNTTTSAADNSFSTFMSTVTGALPTAATAISNFLSEQNSAISQLADSTKAYHKAYKDYAKDKAEEAALERAAAIAFGVAATAKGKLDAAIARKAPKPELDTYKALSREATKSLTTLQSGLRRARERMTEDQGAISETFKALGEATRQVKLTSDPATFTKNLQQQTSQSKAFVADLSKLVRGGFVALARELATQGPEQAGKLADAFAGNASKAKAANAAIKAATAWALTYTTTMQKLFDTVKKPTVTVAVKPQLTGPIPAIGTTFVPIQLPSVASVAAANPALNAAPKQITTLALDLTVVLDDGSKVNAAVTLPLELDGGLTQRVKSEVHAS